MDRHCRVCFESEEDKSALISPCQCRGSSLYIHIHCLELWQNVSLLNNMPMNALVCPVCKTSFRHPSGVVMFYKQLMHSIGRYVNISIALIVFLLQLMVLKPLKIFLHTLLMIISIPFGLLPLGDISIAWVGQEFPQQLALIYNSKEPYPSLRNGVLLVASKRIPESSIFHETVILLLEHNPEVGSKGVILNFYSSISNRSNDEILQQLNELSFTFDQSQFDFGGPMDTGVLTVIHHCRECSKYSIKVNIDAHSTGIATPNIVGEPAIESLRKENTIYYSEYEAANRTLKLLSAHSRKKTLGKFCGISSSGNAFRRLKRSAINMINRGRDHALAAGLGRRDVVSLSQRNIPTQRQLFASDHPSSNFEFGPQGGYESREFPSVQQRFSAYPNVRTNNDIFGDYVGDSGNMDYDFPSPISTNLRKRNNSINRTIPTYRPRLSPVDIDVHSSSYSVSPLTPIDGNIDIVVDDSMGPRIDELGNFDCECEVHDEIQDWESNNANSEVRFVPQVLLLRGCCLWAPHQLDGEIRAGEWHIVPAKKDYIFLAQDIQNRTGHDGISNSSHYQFPSINDISGVPQRAFHRSIAGVYRNVGRRDSNVIMSKSIWHHLVSTVDE